MWNELMKNLSLFKIVIFYLMLGIIVLLVTESVINLLALEKLNPGVKRFLLYRDLLFLAVAAIILYCSVRFYTKSYRTTELNYQKLFNGSPLPMYVMARGSLKILAVNEAMSKLYGYTEDEFLHMTALNIRPAEEWGKIRAFLSNFGEPVNDSGRWLHQKKNGDLFYVQITLYSVPLTRQDAYLVMVTDLDKSISDEKKISDLLGLYETVNKATNDVIWDYDLVNDRLKWMHGYYEKYGYSAEHSTSSFWAMKKIHPDDREWVQREFLAVLENKRNDWSAEYRYICADGCVKFVRDKGYVIFNENDEPFRMIGAMQDIDEQKRFEQQLLDQNEQLKEIAWINSHEVRRPLSNILGLINLIRNYAYQDQEMLELIELLEKSSKELDSAVILINRQTMDGGQIESVADSGK